MLVLSSAPPLPAGAPGLEVAPRVMVLGSFAARGRGLVLSFALGAQGDVWLCVLWYRSGSERDHVVTVPAQMTAGLLSGTRDAEALWIGLIPIWDVSLCCTRFTESIRVNLLGRDA